MSRILSGGLAVVLGVNALAMLFASFWWYNAVPGVTATGAYNPHFVRDIGAAYLVVAGGLGWFAWRPIQGWPALVASAAFLVLHAFIHVFDANRGFVPSDQNLLLKVRFDPDTVCVRVPGDHVDHTL